MQVEPVPSTPPLGRINDQSGRVIGNGSISAASSVTKQPRCPQNRRDKPIQNEISSQCSYSARSCAPFHSVTLSGAELRGWSCCSVSSRSAEDRQSALQCPGDLLSPSGIAVARREFGTCET